jgi:hypothetical protein
MVNLETMQTVKLFLKMDLIKLWYFINFLHFIYSKMDLFYLYLNQTIVPIILKMDSRFFIILMIALIIFIIYYFVKDRLFFILLQQIQI